MTELNLTPEQVDILKETLDSYQSDLTTEIAHTDNREFREMLKNKKTVLNEIVDMLTN